jgi:hypothetical protein
MQTKPAIDTTTKRYGHNSTTLRKADDIEFFGAWNLSPDIDNRVWGFG